MHVIVVHHPVFFVLTLPPWSSGRGVGLEHGRPWVRIPALTYQSLKKKRLENSSGYRIGVWHCEISARTGWQDVQFSSMQFNKSLLSPGRNLFVALEIITK